LRSVEITSASSSGRSNRIRKESWAVTHYRAAIIDGHKVFYREAGDPEAPKKA